ncbi:MAG: YwiC-like family protein [Nigerium sp.]|nr:YwiC-like family protein [Nigerium sp.]
MGRKRAGWVPDQHGAWSMITLPFAIGLIEAVRAGVSGSWTATLFAFWLLGYFAFNAASGWLKAPPRRRPPFAKPLATYVIASAVAGLATVLLGGWGMAWWAVVYVPLLLPALWLASRRRERATLGGALTIAAASLMLLVVRFPDPVTLLDAGADAVRPLLLAGAMFAYFFGTVLYVKTNIRERGSRPFLIASIGWHAGATVAASALASAGPLPWWWAGFFLITTVRAADVPRRVWTPRRIGFLEACLCVVMLIGHLVSRPG